MLRSRLSNHFSMNIILSYHHKARNFKDQTWSVTWEIPEKHDHHKKKTLFFGFMVPPNKKIRLTYTFQGHHPPSSSLPWATPGPPWIDDIGRRHRHHISNRTISKGRNSHASKLVSDGQIPWETDPWDVSGIFPLRDRLIFCGKCR